MVHGGRFTITRVPLAMWASVVSSLIMLLAAAMGVADLVPDDLVVRVEATMGGMAALLAAMGASSLSGLIKDPTRESDDEQ